MKLNDVVKLYCIFPEEPEYVEDEVEIWIDLSEEQICLFKDSLHYVIAAECAWVVNHCEIQNDQAETCFPKLFVDYCLNKNSDESYLNHLFPDYQGNTICLTKTPYGDMKLEIWRLDPFSDTPLCEIKYSFTVSLHDFMEWWNKLLSLDTTVKDGIM